MAQADQVLLGVLQGLGSITIHSLSGQLEDFSKGNPAAVLPTAEALVSTYPLASLILTANYTCSTAASELEFLRTASQVVNQVTSASLSACKCAHAPKRPAAAPRIATRVVQCASRPSSTLEGKNLAVLTLRPLISSGALLAPGAHQSPGGLGGDGPGTASGVLTTWHAPFLLLCLQTSCFAEGLSTALSPITTLQPSSAPPLTGKSVVQYYYCAGSLLLAMAHVGPALAALKCAFTLIPTPNVTRTALDAFQKWLLASTLHLAAGDATPLSALQSALSADRGAGGGGGWGKGGSYGPRGPGDNGPSGLGKLVKYLIALSPGHVALHDALCMGGSFPGFSSAGGGGSSSSSNSNSNSSGNKASTSASARTSSSSAPSSSSTTFSTSIAAAGDEMSGGGGGEGSSSLGATLGSAHLAVELAKRGTRCLGDTFAGQLVRGDLDLAITSGGGEVFEAGNALLLRAALGAYAGRFLQRLGESHSLVTVFRALAEAGLGGGTRDEAAALALLKPVLATLGLCAKGARGKLVTVSGAACVEFSTSGELREDEEREAQGSLNILLQGVLGMVDKVRAVEETAGTSASLASALCKGGRSAPGGGGGGWGGEGSGRGRYEEGGQFDPAVVAGLLDQKN